MSGVFITGTDTEIGKTHASVALIQALRRGGLKVNAMKPVAAGLEEPSDARRLQRACGHAIGAALLNPVALPDPIAPHVAAQRAGVTIQVDAIHRAFLKLRALADFTVVEGVGGWMVPLGPDELLVDLVRVLELPVVLVVGLKLGCLNHALLSARCIRSDGLELIGWVGNAVDPDMSAQADNVAALKERLKAPCLGLLPFTPNEEPNGLELDVTPLIPPQPGSDPLGV
ncbi:MAG: dethiobiotin synthase [Pseudomonadota bacterium]